MFKGKCKKCGNNNYSSNREALIKGRCAYNGCDGEIKTEDSKDSSKGR